MPALNHWARPFVNFYDIFLAIWFLVLEFLFQKNILQYFYSAPETTKGWIGVVAIFLSWLALFTIPLLIKYEGPQMLKESSDLVIRATTIVIYLSLILTALIVASSFTGIFGDPLPPAFGLIFTLVIIAATALPLVFFGLVDSVWQFQMSRNLYLAGSALKYILLLSYVILSAETLRLLFIPFSTNIAGIMILLILVGPIAYVGLIAIPRIVLEQEFPIRYEKWLLRYGYFALLILLNGAGKSFIF